MQVKELWAHETTVFLEPAARLMRRRDELEDSVMLFQTKIDPEDVLELNQGIKALQFKYICGGKSMV